MTKEGSRGERRRSGRHYCTQDTLVRRLNNAAAGARPLSQNAAAARLPMDRRGGTSRAGRCARAAPSTTSKRPQTKEGTAAAQAPNMQKKGAHKEGGGGGVWCYKGGATRPAAQGRRGRSPGDAPNKKNCMPPPLRPKETSHAVREAGGGATTYYHQKAEALEAGASLRAWPSNKRGEGCRGKGCTTGVPVRQGAD